MAKRQPKVRLIAGPNGSGKSSLLEFIKPEWRGVYINADDIAAQIQSDEGLDLGSVGLSLSMEELVSRIEKLGRVNKEELAVLQEHLCLEGGRLSFRGVGNLSYTAASIADICREELLASGTTFTIESVMSHRSKVEFLCRAQQLGFRTYLYFVATGSQDINVARVKARVEQGGHDVPEEKIRTRYVRSMNLLIDAVKCSSRAYIFDNSGDEGNLAWLAEFDGENYEVRTSQQPQWFMEIFGPLFGL